MTDEIPEQQTTASGRLLRRMVSRDPEEAHRAATPLELLYDLCFVVAIAQAAAGLHHGISEGHGAESAVSFGIVFFAIWWAWMGFAWFASAFDTDDVVYRLKVLVQIVGVLVLAAGVPRAFEANDFGFMTLGYVIMRVGLVAQWLRAARADPARRRNALRHAFGITACQIGWVALLAVPADQWIYGFLILVVAELAVPVWAQRAGTTAWHPHHIAERYGLLTIIVIGESVLAATLAIQSALDAGNIPADLVWVIAAAPPILFSMWWLYFSEPHHDLLDSTRRAFLWGYSHLFVFASVAAAGAGIAVAVDHATHHSHVSAFWADQALALPIAVYLLSIWFVQCRPSEYRQLRSVAFLLSAGLILLTPLAPATPVLIGGILAALTAVVVVSGRRTLRSHPDPA